MYFLSRVKFLKEGGVKPVETSVHNDLKSAQAKFHRNVGTDMDDATLNGSFSVIVDSDGNRRDFFTWGEIVEVAE